MQACPYCDAELNGPTHRFQNRATADPSASRSEQELVACPDCGGVIDGFSSH